MLMRRLLAACVIALLNRSQFCQADVFLDYPGDIKLGALFPIHKQGNLSQPCSEIQKEDGIQPLEAMLFTLDEINSNEHLLPGITLGAKVYDSCDNPIHGVDKSVNLIKGFMARKANLTCDNVIDADMTAADYIFDFPEKKINLGGAIDGNFCDER